VSLFTSALCATVPVFLWSDQNYFGNVDVLGAEAFTSTEFAGLISRAVQLSSKTDVSGNAVQRPNVVAVFTCDSLTSGQVFQSAKSSQISPDATGDSWANLKDVTQTTAYSRFLPFGVSTGSATTFGSAAEKTLESVAGARYHDTQAEQLIASLSNARQADGTPEVFVVRLSTATTSTSAITKLVSDTLRAMPAHYVVALIGNAAGVADDRRRQAPVTTTSSSAGTTSSTGGPTPVPAPVPTPTSTPVPIDYGGAPPGVWDCIVLSLFFVIITIVAFQRMCILQTPTHFVSLKKTK